MKSFKLSRKIKQNYAWVMILFVKYEKDTKKKYLEWSMRSGKLRL